MAVHVGRWAVKGFLLLDRVRVDVSHNCTCWDNLLQTKNRVLVDVSCNVQINFYYFDVNRRMLKWLLMFGSASYTEA